MTLEVQEVVAHHKVGGLLGSEEAAEILLVAR